MQQLALNKDEIILDYLIIKTTSLSVTVGYLKPSILLLFITSFCFQSYSQMAFIPESLPTANAQAISKASFFPVSKYTGEANVNIPIMSLPSSQMELPISIGYDASGVQVNRHPGMLGQNWSLGGLGVITRSVKGTPDDIGAFAEPPYMDESVMGVPYFLTVADGSFVPELTLQNSDTQEELEERGTQYRLGFFNEKIRFIDSEPDIFNFSVNGINGRFFLGADGEWHVISDHNVTVEFDVLDGDNYTYPLFEFVPTPPTGQTVRYPKVIRGFKLIDDTGTTYTFGYNQDAIEYSIPFWKQQQCANSKAQYWTASSWYITKIEDVAGNQIYSYQYERGYFTAELYLRRDNLKTECANTETCIWGEGTGLWTDSHYGSNFNASNYFVVGNLKSPVYIKTISGNTSDYLVFEYSNTDQLTFDHSPELRSYISEYYFANYDLGTPGVPLGCGQYTIPYLQMDNPYSYDYIAAQTNPFDGLKWRKLDRITRKHQLGTLETADFIYKDISTERLKLEKLELSTNDDSYTFTYNDFDLLPGYLSRKVDHWGYFNNSSFSLGEDLDNSSTNLDFINEGAAHYQGRESNLTYLKYGSLASILYPTQGIAEFTYELHDYSKVLSEDRQSLISETGSTGGLRIKKIDTYDKLRSVLLDSKEYLYKKDYQTGGTSSSGILSLKPKYAYVDWTFYAEGCPNGGFRMDAFSTNNLKSLGNFFESPVAYPEVTELRLDGSYSIHKYTSHENIKDELPYTTLEINPNIYGDVTSRSYQRGKLKFVGKYDVNSIPVEEVNYTYRDLTSSTHYSVVSTAIGEFLCSTNDYHYRGSAYKMPYDKHYLVNKEVKKYFGSESVSTNYDYTHSAYHSPEITSDFTFLSTEAVMNSDNKQYKTEYYYPFNVVYNDPAQSTFMDMLVSDHRLSPAVRTLFKVENVLVDGMEYRFGQFSNILLPEEEYRYEYTWNNGSGSGSWELQKSYLEYNTNWLKPTKFQLDGWLPTTLTYTTTGRFKSWNYNNSFSQTFEYHNYSDLLKSVTDVDGQIKSYTYDNSRRLKTISERGGNILTSYDYFDHINSFEITKNFGNDVSLISKEIYDGIGRTKDLIKKDYADDDNTDVSTGIRYNNLALKEKEIDEFGNEVSYTYYPDPLDRVHTITDRMGFVTTKEYGTNNTEVSGYAANTLFRETVIDPDGRKTISYIDKLGREIMSRQSLGTSTADTYKEYDDKNRIVKIIPPDANITLSYMYTYDGADNILTKKIPDRSKLYFAYDDRNLMIGMKDAHIVSHGKQWMTTLYDEYGRVKQSGFGNINGTIPTITDVLISNNYDGDGTSNSSNPIYKGKLHRSTVNILDGFDKGDKDIVSTYTFDPYGRSQHIDRYNQLMGLESYDYIFDEADNPITTTHVTPAVTSILTNGYDLQGRMKSSALSVGGETEQILSDIDYLDDDQLNKKHLRSGNEIISLSYNDNRWLTSIHVPNTNYTTDFLCTPSSGEAIFDFNLYYNTTNPNIAAPLMKNGNISSTSWTQGGIPLMSYGFNYDFMNRLEEATSSDNNAFRTQYGYDLRGNIESITRHGYTMGNNCYTSKVIDHLLLTYPAGSNRLSQVHDWVPTMNCPEMEHLSSIVESGNYGTKVLLSSDAVPDSDKNIILISDGKVALKAGFAYSSDGTGTLIAENDDCPENNLLELDPMSQQGFVERSDTPYSYDLNGNLTVDTDKEITYKYNHLNLPYEAMKASDKVEWLYTASGEKLRKTTTISGSSSTKEYRSEIETDDSGYVVHHGEGQVREETGNLNWEYSLKDHLGNVRILYSDSNSDGTLEILQNNQYYPFGMSIYGEWTKQGMNPNNYKYNGKELQKELKLGLLDYGARLYDPTIGRFTGVDPISEQFAFVSPYNYAENEPIANIDLWGLQKVSVQMVGEFTNSEKSTILAVRATVDMGRNNEFTYRIAGIFDREFENIATEVKDPKGIQIPKFIIRGGIDYAKSKFRATKEESLSLSLSEEEVRDNYRARFILNGIRDLLDAGIISSGHLGRDGTEDVGVNTEGEFYGRKLTTVYTGKLEDFEFSESGIKFKGAVIIKYTEEKCTSNCDEEEVSR